MSFKRVIARNVMWNWAGMVVPMLAGFIVAPFLVHQLGDTRYGLWILIASLTSYFGLLDLGVRGSVGRNIAFHRAKDDRDGANAVLSTAAAILCLAGLIALAGTFALLFLFFRIFEVPAADVASCRLALLIVGVNLALTLPLNVFDATLWAFQRFDLLNAIDIPAVVLRTILTFYFIGTGHGLVALALITLLTTVASSLVKAWLSFAVEPALAIAVGNIHRWALRSLCSYGIWLFVLSVTRLIISQINPIIIGARLTPALVTPYSIAMRLMGYAGSLLLTCTNVLTPVATTLHAQGSEKTQRTMFVRGGTYCSLIALYFLTGFVFLGRPFIRLWMGPSMEHAWPLLVILALGETLPMSQWMTYSMVLGIGRHRFLACVSLLECAAAVAGTVVLLDHFGLAGACIALAVPATVCRGVVQMLYGCRVVGVPVAGFAYRALLLPLLSALPPALLIGLLASWREPRNWFELAAFAACYSAFYLFTWLLCFDPEHLRNLRFGVLASKLGVWRARFASAKM